MISQVQIQGNVVKDVERIIEESVQVGEGCYETTYVDYPK